MAQFKLRSYDQLIGIKTLLLGLATSLVVLFLAVLSGCAHAQGNSPVGLSLLFLNKGPYAIGVTRFAPDGQHGPAPGALGSSPTDGAQMTFMAGASKRGVPQFVEVGWSVSEPAIKVWFEETILKRKDKYSPKWNEDYKVALTKFPTYSRSIDLTSIITPELLAQVRANRSTTNLKMMVIFKDEGVTVIAEPEVWNRLRFSATDESPAASAERRADFIAGSTQAKQIFYAQGYYVGQVAGVLTGSLTLSVHVDGTLSAVIASADQAAIVLNGIFDITSNDAVRTLKLTGNSTQGTTTLSGHIDLKARTVTGEWTTTPSTANSPSLSGSFTAAR